MWKEQKYWNPVLETLPHAQIRDLQFRKFKKIFEWGYEKSKFHRSLYDKAGIKPGDIRTFEDIRRILGTIFLSEFSLPLIAVIRGLAYSSENLLSCGAIRQVG